MPRPRRTPTDLARALIDVAPLATRWIERLLSANDPPMTVSQYLALRSIAQEEVSGSELARRTGVSDPAVSQLLAGLADAGLIDRTHAADDRRRQHLMLSPDGERAFRGAEALLLGRFAELLVELPAPDADALVRSLPDVEALLAGTAPPRRPHPRPGLRPHAPHPR